MPTLTAMPREVDGLLQAACESGFDKAMYAIDLLDGDIDPPLEIMTSGLTPSFMQLYLSRFREAPPTYAITLATNAALATYDYFGRAYVFKLRAKF